MASRELPNLKLRGFWTIGEDGWNQGNDTNLLKLSVLTQARAIDLVAALPGAPVDGDVYVLTSGDIGIRDAGAWVMVTPLSGWTFYNQADSTAYRFDGATWAAVAVGGGGGQTHVFLTQAAYDALNPKDAATLYFITG